jgi:hypothetical protein
MPDPASAVQPPLMIHVPEALLVNVRIAWQTKIGGMDVSLGLEAFNVLNSQIREFAFVETVNTIDYGGEMLDRKVIFFLRGQI